VGRVNFADPAVTKTLVPSKLNETGLLGRFLEISDNNLPGTNTRPGSLMSALKEDLAEVSKSDAESVTSLEASITIPKSAVIIGLVERLRETQLTESVRTELSTVNFIVLSLSFLIVGEVRSQSILCI
jgi:hypothetical protein